MAIQAFATVFFIPMGFSIAAGLSMGMILYPFTKVVGGRAIKVPPVTWILAAIFLARYVFTTSRFG